MGTSFITTSIPTPTDRKSTRLNSSHLVISYAVFCLKKKKNSQDIRPATRQPDSTLPPTTHLGARPWPRRTPLSHQLTKCKYSTSCFLVLFFFNDTATTEIYTLSLPDALPISYLFIQPCEQLLVDPIESAVAEHRRSEEHTSELQSPCNLVCRLLLEKKKE